VKAELLRFKENANGCPGVFLIDGELMWLTFEPDSKDPERFQIPVGNYRCFRTPSANFGETFEIEVAGHTLIRFHWGNKEEDSTACVLLGMAKGTDAVWNSRVAFNLFMKKMEGITEFILEVKQWN